MEINELTFEEKTNLVRLNLKKLIESKKELSQQKQITLMNFKEVIDEARKADIGYLKISKCFQLAGIEVTKHDLSIFCKDVLGEVTPERKSNKKKPRKIVTSSKKIAQPSH